MHGYVHGIRTYMECMHTCMRGIQTKHEIHTQTLTLAVAQRGGSTMGVLSAHRLGTRTQWRTVIRCTTGRERGTGVVPRGMETLASVTSLFEGGGDSCIGRQLTLPVRVAGEAMCITHLVTSLAIGAFDPSWTYSKMSKT